MKKASGNINITGSLDALNIQKVFLKAILWNSRNKLLNLNNCTEAIRIKAKDKINILDSFIYSKSRFFFINKNDIKIITEQQIAITFKLSKRTLTSEKCIFPSVEDFNVGSLKLEEVFPFK